jgi:hypothetical protein
MKNIEEFENMTEVAEVSKEDFEAAIKESLESRLTEQGHDINADKYAEGIEERVENIALVERAHGNYDYQNETYNLPEGTNLETYAKELITEANTVDFNNLKESVVAEVPIDDIQNAVQDAINDRLDEEGYNFDSVKMDEDNAFTLARDNIDQEVTSNAEAFGLKEVEVVGETQYTLPEGKELDEFAKEAVDGFDLSEVVQAGYQEKYEISESLKDEYGNIDIDAIKAFENGDFERVTNNQEVDRYEGFNFGEEIAAHDTLYSDSKDTLMSREEGIEKALEAGVDPKELAEATSEKEVEEAALKVGTTLSEEELNRLMTESQKNDLTVETEASLADYQQMQDQIQDRNDVVVESTESTEDVITS